VDALRDGRFSSDGPDLFQPLYAALVEHGDVFYHLADFDDYVSTQHKVERNFSDTHGWARRAALNVARIGRFSSDRTVREYAEQTWRLRPVR